MIFEKDYPDGLNMEHLEHVKSISCYNNNYYKGVKNGDLLFGKSDDARKTEWYLIRDLQITYLGESYVENEELFRYEKPWT